MTIGVACVPLRELYRREMGCQVVHDSLPRRGFGDLFLIRFSSPLHQPGKRNTQESTR
jgi:hypothetical protein